MKPLELPIESQKALLNGAPLFLIPRYDIRKDFLEESFTFKKAYTNLYTKQESLYQIGDEVYLQEDNHCPKCNVFYNNKMRLSEHIEQCDENYKYKANIKDVKVVRLHCLSKHDIVRVLNGNEDSLSNPYVSFDHCLKYWYNKQYGNYEDNPYVFLYEVKELQ